MSEYNRVKINSEYDTWPLFSFIGVRVWHGDFMVDSVSRMVSDYIAPIYIKSGYLHRHNKVKCRITLSHSTSLCIRLIMLREMNPCIGEFRENLTKFTHSEPVA